jgi:hypothetical protein
MYVGGVVLLRNFPFVGEVRLTVLTRLRERAIRSYWTTDRVGPSKRDFTSQSEMAIDISSVSVHVLICIY